MKIISLLPSSTEILCQLGLEENIFGVTHECDYPDSVERIKSVGFTELDFKNKSSLEIESIVSENKKKGKSSFIVDIEALEEIKPDFIVTQDLCEICAVSKDLVTKSINSLSKKPKIITLGPKNLKEVSESFIKLGNEFGLKEKGVKISQDFDLQLNDIIFKTKDLIDKPRVFCMEWLDPIYSAGHWVPEMVDAAGGVSSLSKSGEESSIISFKKLIEYAPNYLFIMPCGYSIDNSLNEINILLENPELNKIPAFRKGQVYIVNANSYFSRPSFRLIEGIKIIARTINNENFIYEPKPDSIINLQNYIHFESFT
jgi:iron complex transport system substrate-binding protein